MPPSAATSPASSSPDDLREYVHRALDNSSTLNSLMESAVGYSPTIYEITISDRDGIVLVSSDAAERGQKVADAARASTSLVRSQGFFQQLRTLYGPPQVYEYSLPFNLGGSHFGDIRIGLSSALIRDEISPDLEEGRILGARLRSALDFARVLRDARFARSDRPHFRAIGPHLRRRI